MPCRSPRQFCVYDRPRRSIKQKHATKDCCCARRTAVSEDVTAPADAEASTETTEETVAGDLENTTVNDAAGDAEDAAQDAQPVGGVIDSAFAGKIDGLLATGDFAGALALKMLDGFHAARCRRPRVRPSVSTICQET